MDNKAGEPLHSVCSGMLGCGRTKEKITFWRVMIYTFKIRAVKGSRKEIHLLHIIFVPLDFVLLH